MRTIQEVVVVVSKTIIIPSVFEALKRKTYKTILPLLHMIGKHSLLI
jgi:hypothetical protein